MGWNSYDCFGGQVTEQEFRDSAEVMARRLRRHGWEYAVIDIGWHSHASMEDWGPDEIDEYGRLLPSLVRFPSAAGGRGFRPLADFVHGLGLRFGIHVMPGITARAVAAGCRIAATGARAGDIARASDFNSLWPGKLHHLDVTKPAAQAYCDSLFALYAEWGVDFVKADGVGDPYRPEQVEALDAARRRCGRDIVLSLSSGCPDSVSWPLHRKAHCEMWRVSEDFWDRWPQLEMMFYNLRAWQDHAGPGHWLDADMLPLGRIGDRHHPVNSPDRDSRLTRDEQRTVMSLWSIAQSPLMFGGDLRRLDDWTLSLLTNDEVLAVNQQGRRAKELFRECHCRGVGWICEMPEPGVRTIGLFNFGGERPSTIAIAFAEAGLPEACAVRDLWARRDLGVMRGELTAEIPSHGSGLYRVTPA